MIGSSVGNYRVVEKLGDGGMGTVYRALDQMLDREVALKVMKPELSRQAALNERFRQEAIALARLNHPNIAAVYGLERNGDDLVMVMEFIRGETLESIVQRSGRLSWSRAFELCAEVLEGLDHAHDKGVVHRDIKPANIMLARDGVVKVMDFGIARIMGRSRQTRVGAAVGTPMYMSPEQLKGEEVDGRSDLYSLGAVLFELITGRMAFEADSDYELMMKQLNEPAPPVRGLVPDAPAGVDAVLQRAMAKRREDRFANAGEMRAALLQAIPAAGPALRRPAPETRLVSQEAAPPVRPVPAVGATADIPVQPRAAVAETRLASSEAPATTPLPPTRYAAEPVLTTPSAGLSRWLTDWRAWTSAAALLVVVALAARGMRGNGVQPASDSTQGTRDTVVRPVPGSLGDTTGQGSRAVAPPQVSVTPSSSGTGAVGGLAPLAPAAPTTQPRPLSPQPQPVRPKTPPPRSNDTPASTPVERPAQTQPAERVEPRPVAAEPPPAPAREETEEGAIDAIAEAIDAFGDAVSEGAMGRVGNVLRADAELSQQWMDLMKERRLLMDVSGAPQVDLAGSRATARFSATLNVRSAFGANKRRSGQFVAELARSGSQWRVVSVRPVGGLSLK